MRQKKNRKKKKNRKIRILTGVVLGVGLAGALFFNVFKIRNIQVAGNTRYTKDEIKRDGRGRQVDEKHGASYDVSFEG